MNRGSRNIRSQISTRLTPWREMFAQVFDNEQYAKHIPEITRVRVTHGGLAPPVHAYYIAAWLKDALEHAGVGVNVEMSEDAAADDLQSGRLR